MTSPARWAGAPAGRARGDDAEDQREAHRSSMGAVEKIAHAVAWRCSERYVTAAPMYRIFKRAEGAAPVRSVVIAMVIAACLVTAIGVIRVARQHEVLQLGLQLSP